MKMENYELSVYTKEDLLGMLRGKENELEMIRETYENATNNVNAKESGIAFLNNQIEQLSMEIINIKAELDRRAIETEVKIVKLPEKSEFTSSNDAMNDLIEKMNEVCNEEEDDDMEEPSGLTVKPRPSKYKVATNNRFLTMFTNSEFANHQIKTINFALAGDKKIIIEFYDYVYFDDVKNENISLEKMLYDTKLHQIQNDIKVATLDESGNSMKEEIFTKCKITDIYTKQMYDYSDDSLRTISAVFSYAEFDVDVMQPVGNEASK